ncbi:MAG: 50S ribosomal protein L11 methyltransferase [Candidatus Zixiibacteriota bacterium]
MSNFLIEQGCGGSVIEELEQGQAVEIKVYYYNFIEAQSLASKVLNYLRSLKKMGLDVCEEKIKVNKVRKKDWEKFWKRDIKPIRIGEKIVVKPSWSKKYFPENITITIDPKMTFGTGRHETTQLCMKEMERLIQPKDRVLDVGTGSGVLAILAAKLGAPYVLALDTDRLAIDSARENIEKNDIKDIVELRVGTVDNKTPKNHFDLVVANLFKSKILELYEKIKNTPRKDGVIILSGILDSERDEVSDFLKKKKAKILRITQDGAWLCFVVQ